jgi:hypothetical protein
MVFAVTTAGVFMNKLQLLGCATVWALVACDSDNVDEVSGNGGSGGDTQSAAGASAAGASGAAGGGDESNGGSAGSAGDANEALGGASGSASAGAAASDVDGGQGGRADAADPCPVPEGEAVVVSTYEPASTTSNCTFEPAALSVSSTIEDEAAFRLFFSCPEEALSGIDFEAQRLRATVIVEAGFAPPSREYAVLDDGTLHLGFELPAYCGGAFPPSALVLTLVPAGDEIVEDDVCSVGNCGAGGFPP